MNIGLDFNTKITKAAVLINSSNIDDCKVFETKNILFLLNGNITAGENGYNKYLTKQNGEIYELDQIIEWNGLVVNKQQISVEKCLSMIFLDLFNKVKTYTQNEDIGLVCISIPYDKFYYWHNLIEKTFSLMGIQKIRILSQPAAFFSQPSINRLHGNLNKENTLQAFKQYSKSSWYKRVLSKNPLSWKKNRDANYVFISISQNNTNVSLVNYGNDFYGALEEGGFLEVVSTQYTNGITRRKIESLVLDYFISEISKDSRNFALKDQKTHLRVLETVNDFLRTPHIGNVYELNLPFVLCDDGQYRTLDTKIDIEDLHRFLKPTFISLVKIVQQMAKTVTNDYWNKTNMGNVIIVGDSFIQQSVKENLPKLFNNSNVSFGTEKALSVGAFNFSRVMTGTKKDFVALEVIPFSVLVRLSGGEFVEMIEKDSTIPTFREHTFEIKGENKVKFIEIHLTTKEGEIFQSLNVWKIEALNNQIIKITVDVGADMKIGLTARSDSGQILSVQKSNTFSFSGAGFEVGMKGKDIRQYITNQFNYLNVALKKSEIDIFEPDENFYLMLKEGDPFKALRYLGHFLNLKSLPDAEMAESKYFEEQGIGGFISGSKISIPKYFTEDPYGFGYVLAHELAHYILIHEEQIILDDEQENEILTEIFVIYSGMSKLFLNGFKSRKVEKSRQNTRGYLDEKILKYIHQIYISKFNINIRDYRKNLSREAIKMLDELVSNIEK